MNKTPRTNTVTQKSPNAPGFLQNKQSPLNKASQSRIKKPLVSSSQYQKHSTTNPITKNLIRTRITNWLANTPKLVIENQTPQSLTYLLQNPKRLLIDHLKPYRRSTQIQRCIEIVNTLFVLVDVYGYFYCDRQMLRVSEDGGMVIWVHERFKENEREFPIKHSSVSELIFVKKVRETLNELVQFPKTFEIQTKNKLLAYLQNEKQKIAALDKFPSVPINKFPKFLQRELSSTNFVNRPSVNANVRDNQSYKSIKLTPNKNIRQRTFYMTSYCHSPDQAQAQDRRSEHSYKNKNNNRNKERAVVMGHRQRIQTTKFQDTLLILENINKRQTSEKYVPSKARDSMIHEKEQKNSKKTASIYNKDSNQASSLRLKLSNISQSRQNSKSKPSRSRPSFQQKQFQQLQHQKEQHLHFQQHSQQKQQTIYQQFNFEPEALDNLNNNKNTHSKKSIKQRKQSVDVWKSKDKIQEKPFQHSTFSTSVTFSSLKAQLETISDQDEPKDKDKGSDKEKEKEKKGENYVITHLYSVEREIETKQKLNANIKKIMRESGMKIAEEDSFENQVQGLLGTDMINENQANIKITTTRESLLIEQFQRLFQSSKKEQQILPNLMQDIENIL